MEGLRSKWTVCETERPIWMKLDEWKCTVQTAETGRSFIKPNGSKDLKRTVTRKWQSIQKWTVLSQTERFRTNFRTVHFRSPSTFRLLNRPVSVVWTVQFNPHRPSTFTQDRWKFDQVMVPSNFNFCSVYTLKKAQMREDWLRESTKLLETDNFGSDLAAVEAAQKVANLSNLISCNQKQEGLGTSD